MSGGNDKNNGSIVGAWGFGMEAWYFMTAIEDCTVGGLEGVQMVIWPGGGLENNNDKTTNRGQEGG